MARYMIIVKGSYEDEINPPASANFDQMLVDMGKYNDMLIKAGVMLAGEGLMPSNTGAKVQFGKGKPPTVKDGEMVTLKSTASQLPAMRKLTAPTPALFPHSIACSSRSRWSARTPPRRA